MSKERRMERFFKTKLNVLILATILAGFISVCLTSAFTYNKIIRDDIINISKLVSTNIYSDIRNELTKPIFVSLTMANDSFVKTWLSEEKSMISSEQHEQELIKYLNGIKEKYHYDSVFLVSNSTNVYYHFNGINKIISKQNQHDQWYYQFLDSKEIHQLDIDTDEANNNRLSIFINCRIEDAQGNLLGVTGVGLELNQVQELLNQFGKDFNLDAMLFDGNGSVLIHSKYDGTDTSNVFDIGVLNKNKSNILNDFYTLDVYQYKEGQTSGYLTTRYIDDLDWYLLIKKDTSILVEAFREQLLKEFFIILPLIFFVLLVVHRLIKHNDAKLQSLAKKDPLTDMLNRRGFNEELERLLQDTGSHDPFYLFILDIDHFKFVNDTYGHLIGDKIINLVGHIVQKVLAEKGNLARWGGDEFTGYLYGNEEKAKQVIADIYECMHNEAQLKEYKITISLGLTRSQKVDIVDSILMRADKALYEAKEKGRNQYCVRW